MNYWQAYKTEIKLEYLHGRHVILRSRKKLQENDLHKITNIFKIFYLTQFKNSVSNNASIVTVIRPPCFITDRKRLKYTMVGNTFNGITFSLGFMQRRQLFENFVRVGIHKDTRA